MLQVLPQIQLFDDVSPIKRLTKKQLRKLKRQQSNHSLNIGNNLRLKPVQPMTANQRKTFTAYGADSNLLLYGCAGTGKTFLSMYLALSEILSDNSPYKRLVIYRSVVPSRDMGFLPGKAGDKMAVYEAPYHGICAELFGRADAYSLLKQRKIIEFESTSFVRGITQADCIVIIDECQNLVPMEIHSVFTRIGENAKILFCGDIFQTDLNSRKEKSGLADFIKVLQSMSCFTSIEFQPNDILRSKLVKEYILTRLSLENKGEIESLIN